VRLGEAFTSASLAAEAEGSLSSLRANGSRECAPDDRLREAIQNLQQLLDCFVAFAPRNGGTSTTSLIVAMGLRRNYRLFSLGGFLGAGGRRGGAAIRFGAPP
jgi:hypothetical protein